MPPAHTTRNSRKKEIPQAFILNWQCPGTQGSKPLVRRPMTACEACRMAKVKCNGKRDCDRCSSRGEVCRYTLANGDHQLYQINKPASATASRGEMAKETSRSGSICHRSPSYSEAQHNLHIQAETASSCNPELGDEVSMDLVEPFHMENAADYAHAETNGSIINWPKSMINQTLEEFDWEPLVDINQNVCCPPPPPPLSSHKFEYKGL
jgi:Fungal Zn(2)-Cys(6) binuclear cluster domain